MTEDLTAWVKASVPRALAYALTLTRDPTAAEDLVQDCYQRLLARSDRYNLPEDGTRLLFKAITNACINWTQRRPPEVRLLALGEEGPVAKYASHDPLEKVMFNELSAAVDAALAELPVEQRAAVELRAMGHSSAEVADILGTTPGNVRVLLHRGRGELARRLKSFVEDRST
jgi:RNA polymerase sigma-70 factor, ECF subfamily